jgi:acetyltransferase-like isoleucine patch superfamily enzyme
MDVTREKYVSANYKGLIKIIKSGYPLMEIVWMVFELGFLSKLNSLRYSFFSKGKNVTIHPKSRINASNYISLGNEVLIQQDVWLNVPLHQVSHIKNNGKAIIKIGDRTRIGPRTTISAIGLIEVESDVLIGLNVTIEDHLHSFLDIEEPILNQGIIDRGNIIVRSGCWIASNSVIVSSGKKLVIGRGSIVSANTIVKESVEDYTIVSGNPAKIVKRYNNELRQWVNE